MSEDDGEVYRVLTANRLSDGAIVYFRVDGNEESWVTGLREATSFGEAELDDALARARVFEDNNTVVGLYDMEVAGRNRPLNAREEIRSRGPSITYGKAATEPDFSI